MTHIPSNLPLIIQSAAPFVNKYGYFGVALLLFLESTGIPLPGETTLIIAALFAGLGHLNIFGVILVGITASVIGDNIAFAIGDFGGRKLILRYGKYVFITDERLGNLEDFFKRYGSGVVLVARFIDGLRQLNGFIAGISDMKWAKFLTFNFIGACLWVIAWSSVGYFGSNYINTILKYEVYFSTAAILIVVILIARFVIKSKRQPKNKKPNVAS